MIFNKRRLDYAVRRMAMARALGVRDNELDLAIINKYTKESMSAVEIAELFSSKNIYITPRSIQRILKKNKATRTIGDAFRLAVQKNRVKWAYKAEEYKAKRPSLRTAGLRYKVLERDNYKCVLCGTTAKDAVLEVDHIKAVVHGGKTCIENLRTLCNLCNTGKRIALKEV